MANLFDGTPTYITVQELKDSCGNEDIIAMTDDELNRLIFQAEDFLDSYIKKYGTKVDENQNRIFPTQEDDIPSDIKKVTVLLCINIYSGGMMLGDSYRAMQGSGNIASESRKGYGVSYFDKNVYSNSIAKMYASKLISDDMVIYLKKYVSSGNRFFRT